MPLPASFTKAGFTQGVSATRNRTRLPKGGLLKPLMIGTEGETDTGKTEFILSCPGPIIDVCLDRGFEGVLDNPNPPKWRRDDFCMKVISAPPSTAAKTEVYADYFIQARDAFYAALAIPEALTVALDCDSDFWELHILAHFGKLTQIWPQTKYGPPKAEHRAIYARAWDSGKIIIGTNKLQDEWVQTYDDNGKPIKDKQGENVRERTGGKERQGFKDQDYLWQIQIRHLHEPPRLNTITKKMQPDRWGLRILKCKSNTSLVGEELWDEDCNFKGLVSLVYPNEPLSAWGL